MLDVAQLRVDTPGVDIVLHFNNAGSALPPRPVLDAVIGHLQREAAIGGYEAAAEAADRIADVYDAVATLIGAQPGRDRVRGERHARLGHGVLRGSLPGGRPRHHRAGRVPVELPRVPADEGARGDRDRRGRQRRVRADRPRRARARDRSAHEADRDHARARRRGGLVNPAAEVGRIAARHGILYLLDACQSVGQLAVDVRQIGCHMLSATGPQVSARTPRHRLPLRAARHHRAGSSRRSSISTPPPGPTPTPTSSATTRAGSRTGSDSSPARSAWASPPATRCGWASTRSKRGSRRSPRCCGGSSRSNPA